MPKVTIYKCDICNEEYRSDSKIHWSAQARENILLDLSCIPGIQTCYKYDIVCYTCGSLLSNAISNAISSIIKQNTIKTVKKVIDDEA